MTFVIKPLAKWQTLRTIAGACKVFAWALGGLGVITALATLAGGSQLGSGGTAAGLLAGMLELIGAGLGFLGLYGAAEVIQVLICIEQNTRQV